MTDKQTEDLFKTLEKHLKKSKSKIEKLKKKDHRTKQIKHNINETWYACQYP